jgi:hypothetical protein
MLFNYFYTKVSLGVQKPKTLSENLVYI